jgi:Cof subfamily protein (haloacid dehalogenase superfamily)
MLRTLIFDLDDTLLDSRKKIRPENQRVLLQASEVGHPLIIATSRPIRAIRQFVTAEILDQCIIISLNGSVVHWPARFAAPSVFGCIGQQVPQVIDALEGTGEKLRFSVETLGHFFATNTQLDPDELWDTHSATPDMVLSLHELDFSEVTKIAVGGVDNEIPRSIDLGGSFVDLRFRPADSGTSLNIVAKDVDKSTTLEKVASAECIDLKRAIAFGDDIPDLDMFACVGVSVSMSNGKSEVRRAASHTIGSCDSDSIAEFIRREVLN